MMRVLTARAQVLGGEPAAVAAQPAVAADAAAAQRLDARPASPASAARSAVAIARTSSGRFISRSRPEGIGPEVAAGCRARRRSMASPSGKLRGTSTRRTRSCAQGRARSPSAASRPRRLVRLATRPRQHLVHRACPRAVHLEVAHHQHARRPPGRTGTGRARRSRSDRGCRRRSRRRRRGARVRRGALVTRQEREPACRRGRREDQPEAARLSERHVQRRVTPPRPAKRRP